MDRVQIEWASQSLQDDSKFTTNVDQLLGRVVDKVNALLFILLSSQTLHCMVVLKIEFCNPLFFLATKSTIAIL